MRLSLGKPFTKKKKKKKNRAGGMAQGEGPEFKPQYRKKKAILLISKEFL
jgi:hypothetical protein